MIIFGFSSSVREGDRVAAPCPHCGQQELVSIRSFRYFHLFFLPVIPLGGSHGLTCNHCQFTQTGGELDPEIKPVVQQTNAETRRPRWHLIGPILVAMGISYNVVANNEIQELGSVAAAQPQVGHVWVVDVDAMLPEMDAPYRFGAAQVVEVTEDGAHLAFSDWYYGFSSTAKEEIREALADKDEAYFNSEIWFSTEELVAAHQAEQLKYVDR